MRLVFFSSHPGAAVPRVLMERPGNEPGSVASVEHSSTEVSRFDDVWSVVLALN